MAYPLKVINNTQKLSLIHRKTYIYFKRLALGEPFACMLSVISKTEIAYFCTKIRIMMKLEL